jgi:hypothetical protein
LEKRDCNIGTYDGELDVSWANFCADLVDIVDPCLVRTEVVRRETNDLDAASSKVGGTTSDLSKFRRADLRSRNWEIRLRERSGTAEGQSNAYGCEVCRVGEEDSPRVADPLVELNGSLCGLGFEIGGDRTEA